MNNTRNAMARKARKARKRDQNQRKATSINLLSYKKTIALQSCTFALQFLLKFPRGGCNFPTIHTKK